MRQNVLKVDLDPDLLNLLGVPPMSRRARTNSFMASADSTNEIRLLHS
jgi:hypothetical protein